MMVEALLTSQDIARNIPSLPKHQLPFPCDYHFDTSDVSPTQRLNNILDALDIQWQFRAATSCGIGYAKGNVWSRAARRKQRIHGKAVLQSNEMNESAEDDEELALCFKIQQSKTDSGYVIHVRWLQGKDSVLFESFCGMLKRQMTT